jgi:hypothetical protein
MSNLSMRTGKKMELFDASYAHPVTLDLVLLTMQSINDKVYLKVKTF